jgi:anti-sigma factor RsiW
MGTLNPPQACSCDEVAERLLDFVEGDLADADHVRIERQIQGCVPCAELVRTYSAVGGLVRAAMEVEVDAALQAELDAAIFGALSQSA